MLTLQGTDITNTTVQLVLKSLEVHLTPSGPTVQTHIYLKRKQLGYSLLFAVSCLVFPAYLQMYLQWDSSYQYYCRGTYHLFDLRNTECIIMSIFISYIIDYSNLI